MYDAAKEHVDAKVPSSLTDLFVRFSLYRWRTHIRKLIRGTIIKAYDDHKTSEAKRRAENIEELKKLDGVIKAGCGLAEGPRLNREAQSQSPDAEVANAAAAIPTWNGGRYNLFSLERHPLDKFEDNFKKLLA